MDDLFLVGEPDYLSLVEDEKGSLESVAGVALLSHELLYQALVARTPAYRQSPSDLRFDAGHLFIEVLAGKAVRRTCSDGIHRRELEQANGFLDVMNLDDGRQRHFRQRF